MFKKIAIALAIALAGVIGLASPAMASTIYGCPDSYLCFYEHDNYQGGKYAFHVQALYPVTTTCINFPNAGQTGWTGGQVNNKISSLILNDIAVSGGDDLKVDIFKGSNCNILNGDMWEFDAPTYGYGLNSVSNLPPTPTWNDNITSVRLFIYT